MPYLFSLANCGVLQAFVTTATLFAFDLDGTLAPIVADPASIIIPTDLRQSLIELNDLAPVAVITGRSRSDALKHLGFLPRFLIGNHGAEGLPGETSSAQDFVRICLVWKRQLTQLLPDMIARGIVLEEKGQTLAVHYRKAADPAVARKEINTAIAGLNPSPRVVSGIFVKNLAPVAAPHKGVALEALMNHLMCQRAVFAGDDVTDEDVFRLRNPAILGIRVGSKATAAAFYLHGQQEMVRLLHEITGILKGEF